MISFADDLLEQAYHLVNKDGDTPKQASLRRAVSTAYYALFHLLIDDAVRNWGVERHRSTLARTFEHGLMKKVCEECIRKFYSAGKPAPSVQLKDLAQAFVELQQERITADYDNSFVWTKVIAADLIDKASWAFDNWRAIRTQDESQDFLLSLFLPKLSRP